jgi:spermidine synthase
MLARILIDEAGIPDGGTLRLIRRGEEFSIMLGGNELMNSRRSGSEEALAQLALGKFSHLPAPRLLIGGLGMGFTLRAALRLVGGKARVDVAELVEGVVKWAHGPLAHLFGGSMSDPRVRVQVGDVAALIGGAQQSYDAILLDVDNGPGAVTHSDNDSLYSAAGIRSAHAALRPGGILGLWSSAPDAGYTRRLAAAGFAVEVETVRAGGSGKGPHHTIWLARRRAAQSGRSRTSR